MKRPVLIALAASAITLAVLDFRHHVAGRERALARIDRHALDQRFPELRAEVRRRYDPVDAELRVARALLSLELDRAWMAELDLEQARLEVERGTQRLSESAAIARTAWPQRPASWQAPMVLGGATYLQLYRERDARLMAEPELWEEPLLAAHRLAPVETGPVRFLTAAYLGNWSSLTGERREAATALMSRAFHDRDTYRLLIRDWLRVAPSRSQALALVPERPWAWKILQEIFTEARDWEFYITARQKWYETLGADLDRSLDEIRSQLEGGERQRARDRLLWEIALTPRAADFAPRLQRSLELLPPGPVGEAAADVFATWLEWALELCLLRECPFEAPVLSRLARLAADPPPDRRALTFLIAGDLPRAELLERRFAMGEAWAGYHLLKAEHLARTGRDGAARDALARLSRAWHRRPRYWIAAREVARARGDADATRHADAQLDALGRSSWPASAWEHGDREFSLTLLPSAPASGLSVEITDAPRYGVVVELEWDGRLVAIERSPRSSATFDLELPVSPELHRLTLRVKTGGTVRPVAVALAGARMGLAPDVGADRGQAGVARDGDAQQDRQGKGVGWQREAEVEQLVKAERG